MRYIFNILYLKNNNLFYSYSIIMAIEYLYNHFQCDTIQVLACKGKRQFVHTWDAQETCQKVKQNVFEVYDNNLFALGNTLMLPKNQ